MMDDSNLNEANVVLIEKLIILSLSKENKSFDEILAREYFRIAKTLSGSEILVLQAALKRLATGKLKNRLDINDVYIDLAKLSGLKFIEIVADVYQSLSNKRLFKPTWNTEKTEISNVDSNYIFAELGLAFMQYLEEIKTP